MKINKILVDIKNSIASNTPIVYISTTEYKRGIRVINEICDNLEISNMLMWSESAGTTIIKGDNEIENQKLDFIHFLDSLKSTSDKTIVIIQNLHRFMDGQENVSAVLNIIEKITQKDIPLSIVTLSTNINIPEEVSQYVHLYDLPYPSREEIDNILTSVLSKYNITLDKVTKNFFIESLNGLSEDQVELMVYSTIGRVMKEKRFISNEDVKVIVAQKRQIINKSGVIEAIDNDGMGIDNIGGLANLKMWLHNRKKVFSNIQKAKESGVIPPRGLFMFGMPGVGKSLTSKVIAAYYNLPLLKMDMALIYGNKSPENAIRLALKLADTIAPCILWVDEVEKAFAGTEAGSKGGETAMRIFGQVLTWMEENKSPVLTVASANDISNIRPELLRRFDEMFFIDFPQTVDEIKSIYEVHLKKKLGDKYNTMLEELDYKAIVHKMGQIVKRYGGENEAGYSGSDIEKIVKEVLSAAYTSGTTKITTRHFVTRINEIRPQRGNTIAALKSKSLDLDAIKA